MLTLIIKSYIFNPALSAVDPAVIELINTGPLPLTTIPYDPPSPGETLIDLKNAMTNYSSILSFATICFNHYNIITADGASFLNGKQFSGEMLLI